MKGDNFSSSRLERTLLPFLLTSVWNFVSNRFWTMSFFYFISRDSTDNQKVLDEANEKHRMVVDKLHEERAMLEVCCQVFFARLFLKAVRCHFHFTVWYTCYLSAIGYVVMYLLGLQLLL